MLVKLTENLAVRVDDVRVLRYIPTTGSIKVELFSGSGWSLTGRSKHYFNKLVGIVNKAKG